MSDRLPLGDTTAAQARLINMIEIRQNTRKVEGFEREVFHFNGRLATDTNMTRLKGGRWELSTSDVNVHNLLLETRMSC